MNKQTTKERHFNHFNRYLFSSLICWLHVHCSRQKVLVNSYVSGVAQRKIDYPLGKLVEIVGCSHWQENFAVVSLLASSGQFCYSDVQAFPLMKLEGAMWVLGVVFQSYHLSLFCSSLQTIGEWTVITVTGSTTSWIAFWVPACVNAWTFLELKWAHPRTHWTLNMPHFQSNKMLSNNVCQACSLVCLSKKCRPYLEM